MFRFRFPRVPGKRLSRNRCGRLTCTPRLRALRAHLEVFLCLRVRRSCAGEDSRSQRRCVHDKQYAWQRVHWRQNHSSKGQAGYASDQGQTLRPIYTPRPLDLHAPWPGQTPPPPLLRGRLRPRRRHHPKHPRSSRSSSFPAAGIKFSDWNASRKGRQQTECMWEHTFAILFL